MEYTEKELIEKAKAGDKESFNRLLKPYLSILLQYAQTALGDYDKACDAQQETLIYAWENIDSFTYTEEGKFKHWLIAACRNRNREVRAGRKESDDMWYRLKRAQGLVSEEEYEEILRQTKGENLVDGIIVALEDDEIRNSARLLPPTQRKVFLLYYDGNTTREIGNILNMRTDTVRKNLRRARKTMRNQKETE